MPKKQYDNYHSFLLSPNSREFRGNSWCAENKTSNSKPPKMSRGMADSVRRGISVREIGVVGDIKWYL